MLYFNPICSNYEEFQQVFPKIDSGGVKRRLNSLLLHSMIDLIKLKSYREFLSMFSHFDNIENLENALLMYINFRSLYFEKYKFFEIDENMWYNINYINDKYIPSDIGVCADCDINAVRYFSKEKQKVFKMKAGKFYRIVLTSTINQLGLEPLPERIMIHICERFARDWTAQREASMNVVLHYGDSEEDFETIYSSRDGYSLGSCMADSDCYKFYARYCDCIAAWITDNDDNMIARCVIFNNVRASNGSRYRLAERQYTYFKDDKYKAILVSKLIQAKLIDGYKRIGAGCHDPEDFLDINGEPFYYKHMTIELSDDLREIRNEDGAIFPYMDSFKYGQHDSCVLSNFAEDGDIALENTNGELDDELIYCQYTDSYCNEEDAVWSNYHDSFIHQDEAIDVRGDWYHTDDINDIIVMPHDGDDYELIDNLNYDDYNKEYYISDTFYVTIDGREYSVAEWWWDRNKNDFEEDEDGNYTCKY